MSGLAILLGDRRTPHSTLYAGRRTWTAHRRVELNKAMQESASLQASLLKFVHVFMVQTAHTAIANARTKLDERLARWILMAHDRLDDRSMPLAHEFLSLMLGVRRAGVTEALHELTAQKLIQSARGSVVVLNRKGIERMAGAAYGTPEAEYRRLIG
jgi:CRP-like cAMP-binding protein